MKILTDHRSDFVVVDRGFRGHGAEATGVIISGTKYGITPKLTAELHRRSTIEAETEYIKMDGRLSRCPLKRTVGDAVFTVLNACCHKICKIPAHVQAFIVKIVT